MLRLGVSTELGVGEPTIPERRRWTPPRAAIRRRMAWLLGNRDEDDRTRLLCGRHELDLDALERFAADGRPDADADADELIAAGECPACPSRYRAGGEPIEVRRRGDALSCSCCGSTWAVQDDHWVASVAGGLEALDGGATPPAGATLDDDWFRIERLDECRTIESVLRRQLGSLPVVAGSVDHRLDAVIDAIVDAAVAGFEGRADAEAEIWWSVSEGGVDPATAETLDQTARTTFEKVRQLLDPSSPPPRRHGMQMTRERFEQLVEEALASLPDPFAELLENVAVVVRDRDPHDPSYGLYQGVPLTEAPRLVRQHPDRITIYQDEICEDCRDEEDVRTMVRETVLHEVGHYFGIGDRRLGELGW